MSRSQKRPREIESVKPARKKLQSEKLRSRASTLRATPVKGEALEWEEVALPDRLEDAEGFLGLEEIDDVEVVKEDNGKIILFRPPAEPRGNEQSSKGVTDNLNDQDEWSGFDDNENTSTPSIDAKPSILKNVNRSGKMQGTRNNQKDASLRDDIQFDVLEDGPEVTKVDVSAWRELSLSQPMLSAIAGLSFSTPTPIQTAAIPPIRDGHDVIGKAVTGSGKTLAFGIPIFEKWLCTRSSAPTKPGESDRCPIALVLAPTRELAHQLTKHLNDLGKDLDSQPRISTVTGGLSILKQQRQLAIADIIVATPGRLWELIGEVPNLTSKLKQIEFLVVDEADRLLSEGHYKELEDILDALDRQVVEEDDATFTEPAVTHRQTLVFSATFHKGLQQKLAGKVRQAAGDLLSNKQSMEYLLKKLSFREAKPTFIDTNPASQLASSLEEALVECGAMEKDLFLYTLILQNPQAKILVFTNSISSVKRLTPLLQNLNQPAQALHSTMPQKARLRSLERFSTQRTILIATDVAARGLDIKGIDLIIHYHVPRTADMYVHRSGRTARAENTGKSIMLCSPDEIGSVMRLISKVHDGKTPEIMPIDRNILSKLNPRVSISQRITQSTLMKEKSGSQEGWLRTAAEELGVDYDSEEFATEGAKTSRGRKKGKQLKESMLPSKDEIANLKSQLQTLLSKRINLGISERYLAGGKVDIDAMLEGRDDHSFLKSSLVSTS